VEYQTPEKDHRDLFAALVLEIEGENIEYLAQYQAQRLASGLHASCAFKDRESAYRDLERVGFDNIEVPTEG
jgi:hypothetical protein